MSLARVGLLALVPLALLAQPTAGRLPDGAAILPNGWPITPAGRQIELSTLPLTLRLTPDRKQAIALNAGFRQPSLSVIDLEAGQVVSEATLPDSWLGLAVDRSGEKVYASGGGRGSVFAFSLADGKLTQTAEYKAIEGAAGKDDWIGDVLLSKDERFLYAANLFDDSISILNLSTGLRVGGFKTGARPYRLALGQRGETLWVSHWGESTVGLYSLPEGRPLEKLRSGGLPSDMVLLEGAVETAEGEGLPITARLFVACANTNSVWVFGLTSGDRVRPIEQIPLGPSGLAPAGTAPSGLALSPDGARLYVAASGANSIVVADVSGARAEFIGAIPTGWYPTAVAETADGGVAYLSGKGSGSRPTPNGPDPTDRGKFGDYVAAQQTGSIGVTPKLSEQAFAAVTERVLENTLYSDEARDNPGVPAGNPISPGAGATSPIEHVILVVAENRTYDQLFGDVKGGAGDPKLTVFGEGVAPNQRRLAKQFALLDNFYAAGDASADGQNWTVAGVANAFVEKLWPAYVARRLDRYPFEGGEPASFPPAGYLWSNALSARISVRNYGLFLGTADPGLARITDADFPGFDLSIPDRRRVDLFLEDFARLEEAGKLPRLMLVRLPNDHTSGRSPGYPTARAMEAEHDLALGKLVEGVSKSKSWAKTAIFIVEDDAQDGADHIDSHRTVALVAGPYVKRGLVDSTFYSSLSMLRTIELILGLRPMTQFDATATPMWRSFTAEPDATAYEAVEPEQSLDEQNPPAQGGAPRRVEAAPEPSKSPADKLLAAANGSL